MNDKQKTPPVGRSLIGILVATAIGAVIAVAGSQGSLPADALPALALPAFAVAALLAYGIQWLAFIPAYLFQSERFYDLIGSLTYLTVIGFAFSLRGDERSLLLAGLIAVWALRLGSFLFLRIRDAGSDSRFDRIKPFFFRFLMTWTLQGLWVLLTAGAALAAMTAATPVKPGWVAVLGSGVWLTGFAIEVVADRQKREFRRHTENTGRFIRHGLWAWSRHPNYFGEILLWTGIATIALPALQGWQYLTLISPVFVYLLLSRVSGVPLLEAQARRRWGDDPEFQAYTAETPVLFPKPPRKHNPDSA